MVLCRFFGQEPCDEQLFDYVDTNRRRTMYCTVYVYVLHTFTGWCDVRSSNIGNDLAVAHNAHADFIGTALKSDRYHHFL